LAINLIVAFLPAAVLGFLFLKQIKAHLFNPIVVASAFIIGGFLDFVGGAPSACYPCRIGG
jgi:undecaprenyl-diphosphatase